MSLHQERRCRRPLKYCVQGACPKEHKACVICFPNVYKASCTDVVLLRKPEIKIQTWKKLTHKSIVPFPNKTCLHMCSVYIFRLFFLLFLLSLSVFKSGYPLPQSKMVSYKDILHSFGLVEPLHTLNCHILPCWQRLLG